MITIVIEHHYKKKQSAGCDNTLASNTTLDKCGICGGDNSMCLEIKDSFSEHYDISYGESLLLSLCVGMF